MVVVKGTVVEGWVMGMMVMVVMAWVAGGSVVAEMGLKGLVMMVGDLEFEKMIRAVTRRVTLYGSAGATELCRLIHRGCMMAVLMK